MIQFINIIKFLRARTFKHQNNNSNNQSDTRFNSRTNITLSKRNSQKVAIKQQQANDRRDIIYAPRFRQRVNRINAEPRNSRLKHSGPFEMKISRKFIAVGAIDRVDWNEWKRERERERRRQRKIGSFQTFHRTHTPACFLFNSSG